MAVGLVPGMVLCGVKVLNDTEFERLDGTKRPNLSGPGVYPRVLVLKCINTGTAILRPLHYYNLEVDCSEEAKDTSTRVRNRSLAYKKRVKQRLGWVDEVTLLAELQVVVAKEYWIVRRRKVAIARSSHFTETVCVLFELQLTTQISRSTTTALKTHIALKTLQPCL
jgi:hypothetical protein